MLVLADGVRKRRVTALAFSATGLLGSGGDLQPTDVWDVTTGRLVGRCPAVTGIEPNSLTFYPGGGWVFIATGRGLVAYSPRTGKHQVIGPMNAVGPLLLSAPRNRLIHSKGFDRQLASLADPGEPTSRTEWVVSLDDSPVLLGRCVSLTGLSDGARFVSADVVYDRAAKVSPWRLTTRSLVDGRPLASLIGSAAESNQIVASPDGHWLVSRIGAALQVFSTDALTEPVHVLRNDNRKHFTDIAFYPSGRWLAATSNDATVKLYDTESWQVAKTYTWDVGRLRSVAFSPDGQLAAVGSDRGKVVVWDVDL